MRTTLLTLPCLLLALAGCGDGNDPTANAATDASADAALPKPEPDGGPVTGMPDTPGPGQVGLPTASVGGDPMQAGELPIIDGQAPDTDASDLPDAAAGIEGVGTPDAAAAALLLEPTSEDAVAVLREYYAAIDAQQYGRAYGLWSGGGASSGQTPQQFADGFADTTQVVVDAGAPGRVEPAAGSRFIQVPVAVRAVRRDGSVHRYAGNYTLRRAVVDGASDEQRAWRIASADLREVQP